MSAFRPLSIDPGLGRDQRAVVVTGLLVLAMVAIGIAGAVYRFPPPALTFLIPGGIAFTAVVMLAITRYDAAVALGFVLLGVVNVEPAPPDLVFLAVITIAAVTGRFDISKAPFAVSGLIAAFLTLNLLSMVEAVNPATAAFFVSITLYLAVFSLWLTGYLDSERRSRTVVAAYVLGAVLSAALGAVAVLFPIPDREAFLFAERAKALFKDPNVLGPFLVPAALILVQEMVDPRLLRWRGWLKLLVLLVLVLGLLFTYSRAGWLNLGIGLVAMFLVLGLRRGGFGKVAKLLTVLGAAGVVVLSVIAFTGSLEFLNERTQVQAYDTSRFGAQETGIQLAEEHPFGVGPGQFDVLVPVSTHSTYVRTLSEQGVLGLFSFLGLALLTLILAGRNAVLGRDTYGIGSAALFGAWCGILANSFFVDTLHWRHLWVVAAMIWAGAMRRPGRSDPAQD